MVTNQPLLRGLSCGSRNTGAKDIRVFRDLVDDAAVVPDCEHAIPKVIQPGPLLCVFLLLSRVIVGWPIDEHCNTLQAVAFVIEISLAIDTLFRAILSTIR